MDQPSEQRDSLIRSLKERAKELNCLYQVEEHLKDYDADLEAVFRGVLEAIPPGWQHPEICRASITYADMRVCLPDFAKTPWVLSASINVQGIPVGTVEVCYLEDVRSGEENVFLQEEIRLINTIAARLSDYIQHRDLRQVIQSLESSPDRKHKESEDEWHYIVDLLRRTDYNLFIRISRKMLNWLCWKGVPGAGALLQQVGIDITTDFDALAGGENRPQDKGIDVDLISWGREIFEIVEKNIPGAEALSLLQKWIQEDRASFLIRALSNLDTSLGDIADSVRRFTQMSQQGVDLPDSTREGIRVALVRRLLTDDLNYVRIAKHYATIKDFHELFTRSIYPPESHGRLGGKAAGLFLASRVLRQFADQHPELSGIKVPKTWYITSDGMLSFMHYNNLDDVTEQKYKDIGQVRQEYPHIIQLFKNSRFTPDVIQGLSMALDDFGDVPLIVRSSSLLEDRFGAAFSGKYKSLFVANQGSKSKRLESLMDAVAEVYSSVFGPDPIEYRSERGLLDFHEEMAVMIQEVVGKRVGKYFLPAYAGVAYSNNEFRWSSRIKREDGLVRLVPGLGTRAVDRLSDDYPILIAPGQPGLRVNVTPDEVIRYSPNKIDVIDLEANTFETVGITEFLRDYGDLMPAVNSLVSVIADDHIRKPSGMGIDFKEDQPVVTCEGLLTDTPFIGTLRKILQVLQDIIETPVDIEFASDGKDLYLLQCRPQSHSPGTVPAPIPHDIAEDRVVFSANRYVSNGYVPDITHVVYVDPEQYSIVEDLKTLRQVGRAVGRLNKVLPKRQFILMGPGRWGSRGDIKLGVNTTYADINNTAVLIEIARKKGNYTPDLSFGTHFFQDLVEASIRYIPLYPDDEATVFNEPFLSRTRNILSEILPEYSYLENVIRVIDVPQSKNGSILKILMNADLDEAVGYLTKAVGTKEGASPEQEYEVPAKLADDHWRWRLRMAESIASQLDPDRFGVKAFYIFGSTKNGTAGPGSDIDLLIHVEEDKGKQKELLEWLEGWSLCLDEMNYLKTGYRSKGLLDVHLVTDEDIANKTSYAVKIDAVTDAAQRLPMREEEPE